MAMAGDSNAAVLHELKEIKGLLQELLEVFSSFSNDGLPLKAQVPTSELLASVAAAAALIARDTARISSADLSQRIQMAQVLSTELVRQFDAYQHCIQRDQLESLATQ